MKFIQFKEKIYLIEKRRKNPKKNRRCLNKSQTGLFYTNTDNYENTYCWISLVIKEKGVTH